ncbi:TPA: hypothetical protein ACGOVU_001790 [Streptococcus suis]
MSGVQSDDNSQLINKLKLILQGVSYIFDKKMELNKIEDSRRKAVGVQRELANFLGDKDGTFSERLIKWLSYAAFIGTLANGIMFTYLIIFGGGDFLEFIWSLVASAILVFLLQKKMYRSKGIGIDLGIIISLCIVLNKPLLLLQIVIISLLSFNMISFIPGIGLIFLIWYLGKRFYPKWLEIINYQIDKENRKRIEAAGLSVKEYQRQIYHYRDVQKEKEHIINEMNKTAEGLYAYGNGWFPKDYYFFDAVDFFIASLENFKASSIKELVNLYDDTKYKEYQIAYQQEMLRLQKEQNHISEKMAEYLRYNNHLQTIQISKLESIRINTAEAASYLKNLKVNVVHNHHYHHQHQHQHHHHYR